ncbi:ABC transporter substrate-binding protein [Shinella sp. S4-D37]|uniref:ABC transporter substrate-binding protein n=1 Tax=Shinella sp. S4-D37 TaxID=3161999 RepID=UPI003466CA73
MGGRRWHAMILAGLLWPVPAVRADALPGRVVSMNVCTDQLAMLVARPGQLVSVSYLARDAGTSAMAEEARAYAVNHGLAEEIFLMKPDLVLAGTYSTRTTVSLLRRLGFRVEEFPPEASLDEVRANLARMGDLLGNPERAKALVAGMDAQIEALAVSETPRLRTALYFANGYTAGSGTLVSEVVKRAGLDNIAETLGMAGTARLPLELLVLSNPELMAGGRSEAEGPALAEQNFAHPAYRALVSAIAEAPLENRLTVCGGPFTLEAARMLQDAARRTKETAP